MYMHKHTDCRNVMPVPLDFCSPNADLRMEVNNATCWFSHQRQSSCAVPGLSISPAYTTPQKPCILQNNHIISRSPAGKAIVETPQYLTLTSSWQTSLLLPLTVTLFQSPWESRQQQNCCYSLTEREREARWPTFSKHYAVCLSLKILIYLKLLYMP